MKDCARCGKTKKDASYRKDGRYRDNLSPICESCRGEKSLSDAKAITRILGDVAGRDRLELLQRVFGALPTVDIDAVPILAAGGPYFGTGSPPEGDFFSKDDLERYAEQTNRLVGAGELRPPSKLGHSEDQRLLNNSGFPVADELPAAGWLENFRVEKLGGIWKLLADVKSVPAKLGQVLASGGYRSRSVELSKIVRQDGSGEEIDGVVTGLAWLGAKAPAVRTLDDIFNLYAVNDVVWEDEEGVQDLISDLTVAINKTLDPDAPSYMWELWVNDVDLTLTKAIASDWDGDTTWVIPFTVGDDLEPVVSDREQWVPSTRKLVEIDAADADPLGGGSPSPEPDEDYSAGGRYREQRTKAREAFTERRAKDHARAADTSAMKLSDEQVKQFGKVFGLDENDKDLRGKVEAQLRDTVGGATETAPAPKEKDLAATFSEAAKTVKIEGLPEGAAETLAKTFAAAMEPKLKQLEERAARGDTAYTDRFAEVRDTRIIQAIREYRLDPAQREDVAEFYNANPELATKWLAGLAVNPILALTYGSDEDAITGRTFTAEERQQITEADEASEAGYLAATGALPPATVEAA